MMDTAKESIMAKKPAPVISEDKVLITVAEAAEVSGCSAVTLAALRKNGGGPTVYRDEGPKTQVYYDLDEIKQFAIDRASKPTRGTAAEAAKKRQAEIIQAYTARGIPVYKVIDTTDNETVMGLVPGMTEQVALLNAKRRYGNDGTRLELYVPEVTSEA